MEVFEYLRGWELPELIPIFEEQQIDADAFENLTNEDIKELIPVLGPRKKFLQKYNEYKSVQEFQALLHPTIIENSVKDDQCSGKSDVSIETRYDSDSTITYHSDTSQNTSVSDSLEKNLAPIIYYSEKATVGEPHDIREISSNGVLQLLKNSDEGKIVMSSYKKNTCFLRNELARIIIKNELKKSQDKKISSARFQELAKEVNDIFIHESPDIYYIPYARTPGGKPITAKGKLWSAYVNLRRNFRRCGLLDNKHSDSDAESSNVTDTNNYDNLEEKFLWLKNNIEPTSEVTENWKITFSQRMNEKDNTIEQYYRKFPCLSQPLGYLLLQNDFDQMYPGREHSLFVKYRHMSAKIHKILQERKDSFINEKLQIFQETHPEPTEDEINLLTLTLLPLLVPTPMKKKIGCNWKPTKIELLDGFMLFVNVWFKNRRAKWRKRERNAMNAMNAAAEFKTGFGTQFNGLMPTISDDTFYSYSTYNNWATKVPSPLGTKPFWPVVPTNHHQSPVNCFNTGAGGSMSGAVSSMLPGAMGTVMTSSPGAVSAQPCPYTTPANPYSMYHHRTTADPCSVMSSSINSLRLKAKQHTGFVGYSSVSPVRSSSAGLSACQYASSGLGVGDRPG